jgi:hypothetical protein
MVLGVFGGGILVETFSWEDYLAFYRARKEFMMGSKHCETRHELMVSVGMSQVETDIVQCIFYEGSYRAMSRTSSIQKSRTRVFAWSGYLLVLSKTKVASSV